MGVGKPRQSGMDLSGDGNDVNLLILEWCFPGHEDTALK